MWLNKVKMPKQMQYECHISAKQKTEDSRLTHNRYLRAAGFQFSVLTTISVVHFVVLERYVFILVFFYKPASELGFLTSGVRGCNLSIQSTPEDVQPSPSSAVTWSSLNLRGTKLTDLSYEPLLLELVRLNVCSAPSNSSFKEWTQTPTTQLDFKVLHRCCW